MESAMTNRDPIAEARVEGAAPDAPEGRRQHASPSWLTRNLPLSLDAYEKAALERALIETWGDASEAARLLGIGRSTFYRKAGKHGIHLGRDRAPETVAVATPADAPSPGGPSPRRHEDAPPRPAGVGAQEPLG